MKWLMVNTFDDVAKSLSIILKCWSLLYVPKDQSVLSIECVVHVTFHPYNPAEGILAVNKVIRYKPVHNF